MSKKERRIPLWQRKYRQHCLFTEGGCSLKVTHINRRSSLWGDVSLCHLFICGGGHVLFLDISRTGEAIGCFAKKKKKKSNYRAFYITCDVLQYFSRVKGLPDQSFPSFDVDDTFNTVKAFKFVCFCQPASREIGFSSFHFFSMQVNIFIWGSCI